MDRNIRFSNTFYLFAMPSVLAGIGQVIDMAGTMEVYNDSESGEEADYKAIQNDAIQVGRDMRAAFEEYKTMTNGE